MQYDDLNWHICADFKVEVMLTGLQLGNTKFCCFLCSWNSNARAEHYVHKDWPISDETEPGKHHHAQTTCEK